MTGAIDLKLDTSSFARFGNALERVNPNAVIARALNHTGMKCRTHMIRTLTKQTGLKRQVIVRALKVQRATYGSEQHGTAARQSFVISSRGGDISLKFFNPKETRAGVTASPFGKRQLFAGTFLKGGRFPNRVTLPLGGHVFHRAGKSRIPLVLKDSGVVIPDEMVEGATRDAFFAVAESDLPARLAHEIEFALGMPGL